MAKTNTHTNRQRRADKARRRQRDRPAGHERPSPAPSGPDGADQVRLATAELFEIVRRRTLRIPTGAAEFLARPIDLQQAALTNVLAHFVTQVTRYGWNETDLREIGRRRLPGSSSALLPAFVVDVRKDGAWGAVRRLRGTPSAIDLAIKIAVVLAELPRLPAAPVDTGATEVSGMDERILRKVRALLAKAESTEYEAEAETFTAKAQQLMSKYAIEQSLAESHAPTSTAPTVRRMWVDAPYVVPKSSLINAVAWASHCRCIQSHDLGFVSLVGYRADLDLVEVLATSLLLQASRAMTLAGPQADPFGTSQTKSFRYAFLMAFAQRIGQRLRATTESTEAAASATTGGQLVPVLAARDDAVDAQVNQLFPSLVSRSTRISNARGWGAGRAAADLARLDRRGTIAG